MKSAPSSNLGHRTMNTEARLGTVNDKIGEEIVCDSCDRELRIGEEVIYSDEKIVCLGCILKTVIEE